MVALSPDHPARKVSNLSKSGMVCFGLLSILLALLAWRYASHAATLLAYPYEWDEDEGYHVYFAKRLLQHLPIYGDINKIPFLTESYPPVHSAALTPFVWAFGPTLLSGRLLSLFSIVGIALLAAACVRQETGRWIVGALAALLIIGSPYITAWGPICRVDALMLFLVFAGLFAIRQYPRWGPALYVGLLLLLLACYTKQQAVFLTIAAFIHLWRANRRVSVVGFAGFAAAGLAVLLLLQAATDGNFWRNCVTFQATDFQVQLVFARLRTFLNLHPLLAVGAIAWLVIQVTRRELGIWSAFALSTVVLMILAGKIGADFNYYLPAVVASSICSALAMNHVWSSALNRSKHSNEPPDPLKAEIHSDPAPAQTLTLLLILSLQALIFWLEPIREPTPADRAAGDAIVSLIRTYPGEVLIERRAMFYLLADRVPQTDFCLLLFVYHQDLERARTAVPPGSYHPRWNPHAFVQAIREKRFSLLVLEPQVVPEALLSEIFANYKQVEKNQTISIGNYHGVNKYQMGIPK